jgi:hypothetical protein
MCVISKPSYNYACRPIFAVVIGKSENNVYGFTSVSWRPPAKIHLAASTYIGK